MILALAALSHKQISFFLSRALGSKHRNDRAEPSLYNEKCSGSTKPVKLESEQLDHLWVWNPHIFVTCELGAHIAHNFDLSSGFRVQIDFVRFPPVSEYRVKHPIINLYYNSILNF